MKQAILLLFALSSCASVPRIDPQPSVLSVRDKTALIRIEGCGYQPFVTEGFTYCRVPEGPANEIFITFIAPPAECDEPVSCVDFALFFPDGRDPYAGVMKKGQTRLSLSWKELTGESQLTPGLRGFWAYTYTIRWKDAQGRARKTVSDGEIRLRIYSIRICEGESCQSYVPMRESPEDRETAWKWHEGEQELHLTTSGRAWVERPTFLH